MNGDIVVGIDGSDDGYHALETAVDLADATSRPLLVVHVTAQPRLVGLDPYGRGASVLARSADELADDCEIYVELMLSGRRIQWRFERLNGDPAEVLQGLAVKNAGSYIVLGRHGKGRLARALLGSVVDRLVNEAKVPVLVVPPAGL